MQPRATPTIDRLSEQVRRKMASLDGLGTDIVRDLKLLARDRVEIPAGKHITKEGERCPQIFLVESGWVFRSRAMPAGQRQIVNYAIAGDLLCADSTLFGSSSFDLMARTSTTLIRVDAPPLGTLAERHRGLFAAMAWTAGQEESILAERVVSLGRRDSLEKLAHALCELAVRLNAIGRMPTDTIEAPFNQEDFADLLGISVIHVNRTFRKLSEEKTAEYRKGRIELKDRKRLAELAGFSPDYLHFT